MAWLFENSASYRAFIRRLRASPPLMFAFSASSFIATGALGVAAMSWSNPKDANTEASKKEKAELEAKARGIDAQITARVNRESLSAMFKELNGEKSSEEADLRWEMAMRCVKLFVLIVRAR